MHKTRLSIHSEQWLIGPRAWGTSAFSVALFLAAHSSAQNPPPVPPAEPRVSEPAPGSSQVTRVPELQGFVEAKPRLGAPTIERPTPVLVELTVQADGSVTDVKLVTGADPALDEAVLLAVAQFRFVPGQVDGKASPLRIRYEYVFEPPKKTEGAPVVTAPSSPKQETTKGGRVAEVTHYAAPTEHETDDLVAVGEKEKTLMVRRELSARELATLPGSNGDVLKAVQNLPGVARTTGEQVVMRGVSGSQVLVNGFPIPGAFHFGGVRSTVGNGLIQSLHVTPGNYDARYGNTNGGIIDILTRRPASDRVHGYAQVDLFDASLLIEGPVSKNATLAFGVRRSYIDSLLGVVLSEEDKRIFQSAPRYYDSQASYDWQSGRHRIRFNAFGSDDRMVLSLTKPVEGDPAVRGKVSYSSGWVMGQAIWDFRITDKTRLSNGVSYLRGDSDGRLAATVQGQYVPQQVTWRSDLSQDLLPWITARVGANVSGQYASLSATAPRATPEGQAPPVLSALPTVTTRGSLTTYNPAAYAAVDLKLGAFLLLPSVRVDYFSRANEAAGKLLVQPRLSVRWALGEATTIKAGVGIYSKFPEVTQLQSAIGNPRLEPELSRQYSVGVEQRLSSAITFDAIGFYKDLYHQVSPVADPAIKYDNNGTGRAYGGEFMLKHDPRARFYGWAAYTVMRSERKPSGKDAFSVYDFDQTHNLTIVAQYRITPKWEIGARFRYVTGNPTTPVIGATFDSDSDIYTPTLGHTNTSRAGAFHQLDLRVDRHWIFHSWKLTAYIDLQNAYNHKNPEGVSYNFNYTKSEPVAGLPLIPSFGVRGEF